MRKRHDWHAQTCPPRAAPIELAFATHGCAHCVRVGASTKRPTVLRLRDPTLGSVRRVCATTASAKKKGPDQHNKINAATHFFGRVGSHRNRRLVVSLEARRFGWCCSRLRGSVVALATIAGAGGGATAAAVVMSAAATTRVAAAVLTPTAAATAAVVAPADVASGHNRRRRLHVAAARTLFASRRLAVRCAEERHVRTRTCEERRRWRAPQFGKTVRPLAAASACCWFGCFPCRRSPPRVPCAAPIMRRRTSAVVFDTGIY